MITNIEQATAEQELGKDLVALTPTPQAAPKTSLQCLAKMFCADANIDPIHYLVRSNTSHDGE